MYVASVLFTQNVLMVVIKKYQKTNMLFQSMLKCYRFTIIIMSHCTAALWIEMVASLHIMAQRDGAMHCILNLQM